MEHYPPEILDDEDDNGTMPENVDQLQAAVVGHRIVAVHREVKEGGDGCPKTIIILDNGKRVTLVDSEDCSAYTALEKFLLHPDRVEHVITGVGTSDGYTTWHIYADIGLNPVLLHIRVLY